MAHFYASIKGNRGEASRMGSAVSGIHGHLRGWDFGVNVDMYVDSETGEDTARVYLTSGSNGYCASKLLGVFTKKDYLE